jgi:hypothetical protein
MCQITGKHGKQERKSQFQERPRKSYAPQNNSTLDCGNRLRRGNSTRVNDSFWAEPWILDRFFHILLDRNMLFWFVFTFTRAFLPFDLEAEPSAAISRFRQLHLEHQGASRSQDCHTERNRKNRSRRPMLSLRSKRTAAFALMALAVLISHGTQSHARAALLLEEPYGFFGAVNPTGHMAVYLDRVCADTPVKLRTCLPGEMGIVISRYQGIADCDWVAIPLIPYLYSVEAANQVRQQVDRRLVEQLRNRFHETYLLPLGEHIPAGSLFRGGWTQLAGVAYERSIFAFRFETTEAQDQALIERLNTEENRSHFQLLYNNCADFARVVLNNYFPRTFKRSVFPDAGMTTPKQVTYKLVRYARKHRETQLAIFEIPQIPGYRRHSIHNKSIAESLSTTAYAVPIAVLNPYLAGGIFVDYLVRGRFHLMPKHPPILTPDDLTPLTGPLGDVQNPDNAAAQVPSSASGDSVETQSPVLTDSGLQESKDAHE